MLQNRGVSAIMFNMTNFNPVPFSEAKKYVKKTLAAVDAGVFGDKEDARENIKKPWEDGTLTYYVLEKQKDVEDAIKTGKLQMSKPWSPYGAEVLNDEATIKIETGEGEGLVFEHRQNAKKRGVLTSNSSGQVMYEYKASYEQVLEGGSDSEFIRKVKSIEKFALGDDDLEPLLLTGFYLRLKKGKTLQNLKKS